MASISIKPDFIVRRISIVAIMLFALIGSYLLTRSKAATPSDPNCGRRVSNYTYQVPFGNAVWNQPICGKPRYANSAEYVNRLLRWGVPNTTGLTEEPKNGYVVAGTSFPKPPKPDDPTGLGTLFAIEVYYASNATTTTRIQASVYDSNLDSNVPYGDIRRQLPESKIPWNPGWLTGEGGDNAIVILDDRPGPTQGRIYKISGYKRDFQALTQCGPFFREERICTYTTSVGRDLKGNYVDYRTYEGFLDQRGVGLSALAGMVRPEEIVAGEIRHAVGLVVPNTAFGPPCSKEQRGTNAEGFTCGVAFAPASKHEWSGATNLGHMKDPTIRSTYTLEKTIPEGILFAIDITDAQIEAWLNSNPDLSKNPNRKRTARIIATAIRDYGMMIVDTNASRPGLQLEGGVNPESRSLWRSLGMAPEDGDSMLKGLITANNLYVVEPPTVQCIDGTSSKYSCKWTSASYDTTAPPSDTTPPTVSITSPSSGASVPAGVVTVNVSATDNVGVTKVEFYVNGSTKPVVTDTTAPYSSGNSISLSAGNHTIKVIAYDAAGNKSQASVSITVTSPQPTIKCDWDGVQGVSLTDLSILIANYGRTNVAPYTNGDCNGDSKVDLFDVSIFINEYGKAMG